MGLDEKIVKKGTEEAKRILEEAKLEAKQTKLDIIAEAKEDCEIKVKNVKREIDKELKTKEKMLQFERKQAELIAKQSVIDKIFGTVSERINDLKDEELFNYVLSQIKNEKLTGDEIMRTNKLHYEKYLKALSTKKSGKSVELDKINEVLKTNFKLSNEHIDINNGFVLEGKFFDLNFAIEEVIDRLRDKYERKIVKELFE